MNAGVSVLYLKEISLQSKVQFKPYINYLVIESMLSKK